MSHTTIQQTVSHTKSVPTNFTTNNVPTQPPTQRWVNVHNTHQRAGQTRQRENENVDYYYRARVIAIPATPIHKSKAHTQS